MAVLNVTPDSFSDGGKHNSVDAALYRVAQMVEEGADLVDIGGESTRPGAAAVPEEQELQRVVPVVEAVRDRFDLAISVDSSKSVVARAAVAAGADFVNDISGLSFDQQMAATVAQSGAGLFLMHTRGRPDQMQHQTDYTDVMVEVITCLRNSMDKAISAGILPVKIAVDPGIGFGKSVEGNLELLQRLDELLVLGRPVLLGTSRKSFIGRVLQQPDPRERLYGTLATVALGVASGARIFRVHDVRAARETALMAWAVLHGIEAE
jgi:dihydropteroate synthase